MEKIEFVKNMFGTRIRKCCASCKHKEYDRLKRLCTKGEGYVRPDSLCADWEVSEKLEKAGIGGGLVKKKSYLLYALNYPQPEDIRRHVTLSRIRKEYEEKYDTIYSNL